MKRLSVTGVVLVCVVAAVTAGELSPNTITKTFRTNNGMYGVASIAGVTTRNGRVSSVSGVKIYPALGKPGTQDMTYIFRDLKSGEKLPEPITFSKEENGRITSGSIKIGPGSVSVSSSARSSFPEKPSPFPAGASSSKYAKPLMLSNQAFNDMFFPYPLSSFNARSFDPWFPNNDLAYRQPPQPRFDSFRAGWPYHGFTPFNYW